MILIGSKAMKHWYPNFPREPKDTDYIITDKEYTIGTTEAGIEYLENKVMSDLYGPGGHVMTPDHLYTLKASHIVNTDRNKKMAKHLWDCTFLKEKGAKIIPELFYKLYYQWDEMFGVNRRSDLAMTAEEFFDNALPNGHLHDELHYLLTLSPTYLKVLKDGAEVEVCEDKFNLLSFEEKCDLVQEEVMVMAHERYSNMDYRVAHNIMLKKFIISHAPLWEAIFIVDNYKFLQKCPFNFITFLKQKQDELQPA